MQASLTQIPYYLPESHISEDICVIRSTFYYRWSTESQVKERKFIGNGFRYDKKKIIEETKILLREAIRSYKGYCSVCHKSIRTILIDDGFLDEGVTGKKVNREYIDELIESASKGSFHIVFTPDSSRIGRRTSVSSTIRDKLKDIGVQMYSIYQPVPLKCPDCYDPFDDDSALIVENQSDLNAQLNLQKIRRNYKTGMPIRIKAGKPTGSLAYGLVKRYRILGKDNRGNENIEVYYVWDKEKVKIVLLIAREFLSGLGTWKISQKLNIENIPSPQGKTWGRSSIIHILKNPIYSGQIRYGWKPVKKGKRVIQPPEKWLMEKAIFKGIWSKEYFDRIKQEILRRKIVGGRAVGSEGLLIGLLKHKLCGYSMFQARGAKVFLNGKHYQWNGYACGRFLHAGTCVHSGIKQQVLDGIVLTEVSKLFNDETRKEFYRKTLQSKKVNIQKLLKDKVGSLQKVESEFTRAKTAYQQGVDTLEEYSENKNKYVPLIERYRREIGELEKQLHDQGKMPNLSKTFERVIKRFLEIPSPEDKRKVKVILNRIIGKIEFNKKPLQVVIHFKALT
ncbi:recombinase family protein [Candidatus Gottesmanbacteria bacterium]|nr:recombinase family protein [Candidatus Gottesmanbacteria bacterium]